MPAELRHPLLEGGLQIGPRLLGQARADFGRHRQDVDRQPRAAREGAQLVELLGEGRAAAG